MPCKRRESGLQLVKCKLPDLVLVDISMRGMNGYQVCASLKNDPVTRNIPLILIVPISHTINQPKAMLSGSVDYIVSPFDAPGSFVACRDPYFPSPPAGRLWNLQFVDTPQSRP